MNNTELITIFREAMQPEVVLLPLHPGPAELGGMNQQRITTHFKLNEDDAYGKWAPVAMQSLAEMVTYSFPSAIQFYTLSAPEDNIIEDPEICIREFRKEFPEEWTEPAEDLPDALKETFVPRKKWDAHTKVTFEVIFQFGQ